jgi:hypothetical protein
VRRSAVLQKELLMNAQKAPKTEPYLEELARWQEALPLGKYRHFQPEEVHERPAAQRQEDG